MRSISSSLDVPPTCQRIFEPFDLVSDDSEVFVLKSLNYFYI